MNGERKVREESEDRDGIAWYARYELASPWRISACPDHGANLGRHHFTKIGARAEFPGGAVRTADFCAICRQPEILSEVERCTCETDSARCPAHQNLGCGG